MNEAELIDAYVEKILEFGEFTLDDVPEEYQRLVNAELNGK